MHFPTPLTVPPLAGSPPTLRDERCANLLVAHTGLMSFLLAVQEATPELCHYAPQGAAAHAIATREQAVCCQALVALEAELSIAIQVVSGALLPDAAPTSEFRTLAGRVPDQPHYFPSRKHGGTNLDSLHDALLGVYRCSLTVSEEFRQATPREIDYPTHQQFLSHWPNTRHGPTSSCGSGIGTTSQQNPFERSARDSRFEIHWLLADGKPVRNLLGERKWLASVQTGSTQPTTLHLYPMPTPSNSLRELLVEELKDVYHAENQLLKALPKMAKAAQNEQLQAAFRTHLKQTETHVKRLGQVFKILGEPAKGKLCHAMKGLVEEGAEAIADNKASPMRDAQLIGAAQRVEHYEMAAYGTMRTFAKDLGEKKAAELLQTTLDEEGDTDKQLTKIASVVNRAALNVAVPE